jgi:hypothetical protein
MSAPLTAVLCAAAVVFLSIQSAAVAQEKTVKQCEEEWRANKAENQAKGIKQKDYVAQCRGGTPAAATAPAAPGAQPPAPAMPGGKGKTARECRAEWQANKAENEAKGITEKQYVAQCRAGETAAEPAEGAAAPSPTEGGAAAPAKPRGKGKTAKECRAEWQANKAENEAKGITEKQYVAQCRVGGTAAPSAAATPSAAPAAIEGGAAPPAERAGAPPPAASTAVPEAGQYAIEAEAKAQCPSDTVVWVNQSSKVYHFAGTRNYGKTEKGAYMCEKEALAQGDRASKSEKHPR